MSQDDSLRLEAVEKAIGYLFKDKQLLLKALTHRSFAKESPLITSRDHNETLEFLGDAVLSLVSAEGAFLQHPNADEGRLSHIRAAYVCQENLAECGRHIRLGDHIRVAVTMRKSGPIDLPSMLSDALEAVIGAVYLDGGLTAAKAVIAHVMGNLPENPRDIPKDPKTVIQEKIQESSSKTPTYKVLSSSGPAHEPEFEVALLVDEEVVAKGQGASKKKAEQAAAVNALKKI